MIICLILSTFPFNFSLYRRKRLEKNNDLKCRDLIIHVSQFPTDCANLKCLSSVFHSNANSFPFSISEFIHSATFSLNMKNENEINPCVIQTRQTFTTVIDRFLLFTFEYDIISVGSSVNILQTSISLWNKSWNELEHSLSGEHNNLQVRTKLDQRTKNS